MVADANDPAKPGDYVAARLSAEPCAGEQIPGILIGYSNVIENRKLVGRVALVLSLEETPLKEVTAYDCRPVNGEPLEALRILREHGYGWSVTGEAYAKCGSGKFTFASPDFA